MAGDNQGGETAGLMRRLVRPPTNPPSLAAMEKQVAAWMRGRSAEPGGAHWNQPDVRGALLAMHGFGCAYCLGGFREEIMGDVEHFRPQVLYPWLKYTFGNLYLACETCNRGRKRKQFPLVLGAKPTGYARRSCLDAEARLLLRPCSDDVESVFELDPSDELARLRVRPGVDPVLSERGEATLRLFGLNVFPHDRARRAIVNHAIRRLAAHVKGDSRELPALRHDASRYRPHGFAVREVIRVSHPELLPSREEEVAWFAADLSDLARNLIQSLGEVRPEKEDWLARRLQIAFQALAILWRFPPVPGADDIARTIETQGLAAMVEGFLPAA